jgi:hypothetical protein
MISSLFIFSQLFNLWHWVLNYYAKLDMGSGFKVSHKNLIIKLDLDYKKRDAGKSNYSLTSNINDLTAINF